jgi:hypothetical protein
MEILPICEPRKLRETHPGGHRVRRLRVLALGHTRHSAVSIFRTDFPALPGHIKKRTQLELNLMHLNKGKFDGKNAAIIDSRLCFATSYT